MLIDCIDNQLILAHFIIRQELSDRKLIAYVNLLRKNDELPSTNYN